MNDNEKFSDARAKLDWSENQINILVHEILGYINRRPFNIISKPNIGGNGVLFYLEIAEPIPKIIASHVGSIIASQRESLDFVVSELTESNGTNDCRDCYFPISNSREQFLSSKTQRKIRFLSPAEREIIHSLAPYKGGNDQLYGLNLLCNRGKHRNLIPICKCMSGAEISGFGFIRQWAEWSPEDVEAGAPIAAIDVIGTGSGIDPDIKIRFAFDIGLAAVVDVSPARPVVPALRDFGRMAREIVDRFS